MIMRKVSNGIAETKFAALKKIPFEICVILKPHDRSFRTSRNSTRHGRKFRRCAAL